MKIEVGKVYELQDGRIVYISSDDYSKIALVYKAIDAYKNEFIDWYDKRGVSLRHLEPPIINQVTDPVLLAFYED